MSQHMPALKRPSGRLNIRSSQVSCWKRDVIGWYELKWDLLFADLLYHPDKWIHLPSQPLTEGRLELPADRPRLLNSIIVRQ